MHITWNETHILNTYVYWTSFSVSQMLPFPQWIYCFEFSLSNFHTTHHCIFIDLTSSQSLAEATIQRAPIWKSTFSGKLSKWIVTLTLLFHLISKAQTETGLVTIFCDSFRIMNKYFVYLYVFAFILIVGWNIFEMH